MLRPTYKSYWDIPGGYTEVAESPIDACTREVFEELGLQVEINSLLVVDWAPNPGEGDKLLFIFDGGQLSEEQLANIRFTDGEIGEWRFISESQLDEVTIPRLARRIRQALKAHKQARTVYLQEGTVPA